MNKKRTFLFRIGAVLVLLAIAAVMMVIGRGHTVYMDSVSIDYNGQTYGTPYKIEVLVNDEKVAKLYDGERGMATCIGQTFHMTLVITQEKGGEEKTVPVTLALPYGMDGISINLPAYLAGLPEEVYLSEFQIKVEEPAEEPVAPEDGAIEDEFAIGGDI